MKRINIYRFGTFIRSIAPEMLVGWLRANVPYYKGERIVPEEFSDKKVIEVAREEHYSFVEVTLMDKTIGERIELLSSIVPLEELAGTLVRVVPRGKNYTCDCPHCGYGSTAYINPKRQIWKCFKCGEAGGLVSFVREKNQCSTKEAVEWLEKKYNIKN